MKFPWRKKRESEVPVIGNIEPEMNTYIITMKDKMTIAHTSENTGTIDITDGNLYFYDKKSGIELIIASGEWVCAMQKEYKDTEKYNEI
jgi:hypothetical protein